jgi:hypothetical protein
MVKKMEQREILPLFTSTVVQCDNCKAAIDPYTPAATDGVQHWHKACAPSGLTEVRSVEEGKPDNEENGD